MAVSSRVWVEVGGNSEVVGDSHHTQWALFKVTRHRTRANSKATLLSGCLGLVAQSNHLGAPQ